MSRPTTFPVARLFTAGVLLLGLIAWRWYWSFDSMPDPPNTRDGWGGYPPVFLVTAALSLAVLVISIPVIWRGTRRQRCFAALLAAFPLLTFILLAWWVLDFAL